MYTTVQKLAVGKFFFYHSWWSSVHLKNHMSVFWPESDRKEKEDDKDAEDKSQPRSIRDRRRPREKRRSTGVSYWTQDVRNFCTLTQTCSIWTLVKAPICPQTWHISNECMPAAGQEEKLPASWSLTQFYVHAKAFMCIWWLEIILDPFIVGM